MSAAQHTPGPWFFNDAEVRKSLADGSYPIALIRNNCHPAAESAANGRLMAAAPDMLAALIVAREFISNDRNELADAYVRGDGSMDADEAAEVGDYDAALLQINAAILGATRSTA